MMDVGFAWPNSRLLRIALLTLGVCLAMPAGWCQPEATPATDCRYQVVDFGARADSTYDSREAIQEALDACSENGGGTVCFPAGSFFASAIQLRDHVTLRFDRGSRLLGTIEVQGVRNAGIIGHPEGRVTLGRVHFADSQDLYLQHIQSELGWVLRNCRGVRIDNVKIEQEMRRQANGVAITFVDGKDALVTNSELTCNDDAFCLKRSAENIHIRNSILCGRQAASYKIGTETDGVFRNISMTNCIIYNSNRAGINIEAVDGSAIDGVRISGIKMYNVASPFYIRLGNRDRYAKGVGSIRNVDISDVHFVGMEHDEGISSSIQGLPGHPVENVTLRNIHISTRGGGSRALARRQVPERANFYPEYDIYGPFPAYGLYARYVRGLKLSQVRMDYREPDLRPAVVAESVSDLEIDQLDAQYWISRNQYTPPFEPGEATIRLRQVRDAFLHDMIAPVGAPLVAVEGERSGNITLGAIDASLSQVRTIEIGPEVGGWLNPTPRADFQVASLTASEVKAGRPLTVEAMVRNPGAPGWAKLELYAGDSLAGRTWRWLERDTSVAVQWPLPPVYDSQPILLRAGKQTLTLRPEPAAAQLTVLALHAPTLAPAKQEFAVEAEIQNTGSSPWTDAVELRQDDAVVARQKTTLGPGERARLTFAHRIARPGHYELAVGEAKAALSIDPIWIDADGDGAWSRGEPSFAAFPEALRAARAGDVLLVNPGHFQIDSSDLPLRVDQPKLSIRSVEGPERTILEAIDANEEQFEEHALFHVSADSVTIEGFTLARAVYNVYVEGASGLRLRHNFLNVSRRYHIYAVDARDALIAENRSRVGRYNVLTMQNCSGFTVRDNYHHEDPCGYMAIESDRNTFLRNHFDSLSWYGISLHRADHNRIEDNLFEGGRILGFQCRQGCNNNEILRNTFLGNRTEAVLLTGASEGNTVAHNNILRNRGLAVTNESTHRLDAAENYWGSSDGPSGAGPGSGDSVDQRVDFRPWRETPIENSWSEKAELRLKPANQPK